MNNTIQSGASHELSASMQALSRRFEAITSNLANGETSGHKRLVSHLRSFGDDFAAARGLEKGLRTGTQRDFSQGTLLETGDPAQLALEGEGFFAVEWQGDVGYVRSVKLAVDGEGFLIDQRGARLLGHGGSIQVAGAPEVQSDGRVLVGGVSEGTLEVVRFSDARALEGAGGGVFRAPRNLSPLPAPDTRVKAGWKERSNVDPLQEMVALVTLQRQYEAAQRALRQNGELGRALVRSLS